MGSARSREERRKRKENVETQRSSNWLVVCEEIDERLKELE